MFASRKWTDRMTIISKSARLRPDSYFRRIVPAASPAGRSWQLAHSPRATQLTPLSVTCHQTTTNRANSGYAQVRAVVSRTRGTSTDNCWTDVITGIGVMQCCPGTLALHIFLNVCALPPPTPLESSAKDQYGNPLQPALHPLFLSNLATRKDLTAFLDVACPCLRPSMPDRCHSRPGRRREL